MGNVFGNFVCNLYAIYMQIIVLLFH